ncbi:hypothetical protein Hanom_Chr01g00037831 [Helianthus anomalus]
MTFDQYIKHTTAKAPKATKVQCSNVEKEAETSAKNVKAESVKEKEAEGVVHTDSSATESDTEPEFDTLKLGVGKIRLKVKPQKKKKYFDEEDSTYIPTPHEKKKKVIKKRKAVQKGVIPRNVRARKGAATMPEMQSFKAPEVEKLAETTSTLEVEVQSVEKPEVEKKKAPESPIFEKVEKNVEAGKDDEDEVQFMGERESTPPPPPVNPTIHIPEDPQEPSSAKKDNSSSSHGFPPFPDNLGPGSVSLDDVGDLFNEGKINLLTKRVSILEKAKKKAESECDELKEKLKKVLAENDEFKLAMNAHAQKNDAKVIDQLTTELVEVNAKYENTNEVNKTLYQMIGELHQSSSNE